MQKGGVLLMDDVFSFILSIIFTINNITLEITTIAGIPRPNIALIINAGAIIPNVGRINIPVKLTMI